MRLLAFERRWMVAIFEAVLPSGVVPSVSLGPADLPMARFADEVVRVAPTRQAIGFRAAAWILALLGPALTGRPRRFMALDPADRAAVLDRLSRSRVFVLRELPVLFKMLAMLGYCGAPDVQRQLGVTRVDDTPPSWMAP